MTSSVDYDIAQLQTDLNRLQSDLARLENELASEQVTMAVAENNSIVAEEIAEAEVLAEEGMIPTPIIPEPIVYENQGWAPTPIPTTSIVDEEIAQAELEQAQQALTTAAAALTDAEVANSLANSNIENMNMINPLSRSQKIRNAISALLAAASTLIAAEAGAMWEEDSYGAFTKKMKQKINDLPYEESKYFNLLIIAKTSSPIKIQEINIKNSEIVSCSHTAGEVLKDGDQFKIRILHKKLFQETEYQSLISQGEILKDFITFEQNSYLASINIDPLESPCTRTAINGGDNLGFIHISSNVNSSYYGISFILKSGN